MIGEVVAAVRAFIDGIDEITEVDQVFLDNATAIRQIGGRSRRGRNRSELLCRIPRRPPTTTLLRPRSSGTFGLQPETHSLNHTHLHSCVSTHCDTPAATHSFTHIDPHSFTHIDTEHFTYIDPHKPRGQGYA